MKNTILKKKFLTLLIVFAAAIFLIIPITSQVYHSKIPDFPSLSEARHFYQQQILKHKKNIRFTYVTPEEKISQVCRYFDMDAFQDDGETTALMGDYLRYSLFDGYTADCEYYQEEQKYYYTFTYRMSYKTTAMEEKRFEDALDDTLKGLKLNEMTDYEKVRTIYDFICSKVTYDYSNNADSTTKYTAYGALVNGRAVCQGYAALFYRMCRESGISARIISGLGKGEKHAWNIVKLGHKYYNVDAAWDAGQSEYAYFLKARDDFDGHQRNEEYASTDFETQYPMAAFNYLSNEKAGLE